MKTIVGSPARKEQFYKRPDVRRIILEAVSSNHNLLISAPRRVGKTSILFDLIDEPDENIYAVYVNTEGVDDPDTFFCKLLKEILNADNLENFGKFSGRSKSLLKEWASRISEISLGQVSLKLNSAEKRSNYEQFYEFLDGIQLEGRQILLMIDEFPMTIEHIYEKFGEQVTSKFLDDNRALRQMPSINSKIKFIYTGSIGLFTAVKKIRCTDRVNDLKEIRIRPLKREDAKILIRELLGEKISGVISDKIIDYILEKIEWWIPFYFQLIVEEIADLINFEEKKLNKATVDIAFLKVVEHGNIYFEHFKSRLLKIFKDQNLEFVKSLLLDIKQSSSYSKNQAIDLSNKTGVFPIFDDIIEVLKHDGYIVEETGIYKFYSPIIKQWWR